jgi:hypothetical protein
MYLVDTNIWLERLLDQAHAEEVGRFLAKTPPAQMFLTDFAFHSLGVVLSRFQRPEVFLRFVKDVLEDAAVGLVRLEPRDMVSVAGASAKYRLDFDDAYQYAAARKHGLTIVSLDADFDRTDLGRKAPGALAA